MRRGLLLLLPTLAYSAVFFGGQWLLGIQSPQHMATSAEVAFAGCLLAALIIGMVAHELGHAVMVRLAGGEVLGVTLGSTFGSVTFHRTLLRNVWHSLALARLRQRRPQDVQRLCADALAADMTLNDRATVLATVAMAKHALLLSGRQQLDEALALDPDAELVSEATRFLEGGWETALAAHDEAATSEQVT